MLYRDAISGSTHTMPQNRRPVRRIPGVFLQGRLPHGQFSGPFGAAKTPAWDVDEGPPPAPAKPTTSSTAPTAPATPPSYTTPSSGSVEWGAQGQQATDQEVQIAMQELNSRNIFGKSQSDPITSADAIRWGVDTGLYVGMKMKSGYDKARSTAFAGTIRWGTPQYLSDRDFARAVTHSIGGARIAYSFKFKASMNRAPESIDLGTLQNIWNPSYNSVGDILKKLILGFTP